MGISSIPETKGTLFPELNSSCPVSKAPLTLQVAEKPAGWSGGGGLSRKCGQARWQRLDAQGRALWHKRKLRSFQVNLSGQNFHLETYSLFQKFHSSHGNLATPRADSNCCLKRLIGLVGASCLSLADLFIISHFFWKI